MKNIRVVYRSAHQQKFDVIHSFSRLAYLAPVLYTGVPKIMSYQREPSLGQVKKAVQLSRKGSLVFTGCSDYITGKISAVAEAVTIYNCIPVNRYKLTETVDEDAPLVFLGRIEPIKGTHIAVEVAKAAGKQLIIAGNIPAEGKAYFEEMIRPSLDDRIRYVGPVNDEQKNELLGKAAGFLMPIQWNEPFGIVMAEAMACGTPVIGFGRGSVPEVVEEGVTGYVCRNKAEMTDKVKQLAAFDRKSVREVAERRFSDTVIVDNYLSLYQRMLQN